MVRQRRVARWLLEQTARNFGPTRVSEDMNWPSRIPSWRATSALPSVEVLSMMRMRKFSAFSQRCLRDGADDAGSICSARFM
jgi:hypothetical protein